MTYDSAYDHGEIYDAVNNGFVQDIHFYIQELGAQRLRVLELACGTGRVTLPLIRAGHQVTAVDISGPMLKTFAQKIESEGLKVEALVEADLSKYQPEGDFDAILIPYKALQHIHRLTDLQTTLATAKDHLRPGGRLFIDVFNPDLNLLTRPADKLNYGFKYTAQTGEVIQIFERNVYDSATQVNAIEWNHVNSEGKTVFSSELKMRMFFPQELRGLLHAAGFVIERDLGDYNGTPFSSASWHQILVSGRK